MAFAVIALALQPVLTPPAVRALVSRYSSSMSAGISQDRLFSVAEDVRAFTIDGSIETLPEVVDGRPGFDSAMVSHLREVRDLFTKVRYAAGIVAMLVALWLAVQGMRGRAEQVASTFGAAAVVCVAVVALCAVGGLTNFDAFFRAFHEVFFPGGNWSFPADSLLIETFPEMFWAAAAAAWAVLILLGSVILAVGARALKRAAIWLPSTHFVTGE